MRLLVASLCVVVRPLAPVPSSFYQIQLGSESIILTHYSEALDVPKNKDFGLLKTHW